MDIETDIHQVKNNLIRGKKDTRCITMQNRWDWWQVCRAAPQCHSQAWALAPGRAACDRCPTSSEYRLVASLCTSLSCTPSWIIQACPCINIWPNKACINIDTTLLLDAYRTYQIFLANIVILTFAREFILYPPQVSNCLHTKFHV